MNIIEKKKKIAVVGRGTAGALSLLHWNYYNKKDFDVDEIDWYYDPNIPSVSVGEGTDLRIPSELAVKTKFRTNDLLSIGGTPKLGIQKEDWGGTGSFLNPFPGVTLGMHLDATKLQEWIFNFAKDKVNIIEKNIKSADDVDADLVMMATGTPKELTEDFYESSYIPVNAAYVTQCDWSNVYPTFMYTLTIARPWGWVFGIPLQGRCSIGYLYNRDISNLEDIKDDVQEVFKRYNLTPTEKTNNIHFNNYYRKNPINERVAYNGNSCFFLEPLEATSLTSAHLIDTLSWHKWFGGASTEDVNVEFCNKMEQIEGIICAHYLAGSKYKNEFWDMAQSKAEEKMKILFTNPVYKSWLQNCAIDPEIRDDEVEFGTWMKGIWQININGLGLKDKFLSY